MKTTIALLTMLLCIATTQNNCIAQSKKNNKPTTEIGIAAETQIGKSAKSKINKTMIGKTKEIQRLYKANVENVVDINSLKAIKITFDNATLFSVNSTNLSKSSKTIFDNIIEILSSDMGDSDISIVGHTDSTGPHDVNLKVSADRAETVAKYFEAQGIEKSRITTKGCAYDQPIGDNNTEAGRAKNRRIEIYISANQEMINKADLKR